MNIVTKLNLNKHPRDCTNLSLVNATNIKVSHDESCIVNEEGVFENDFIRSYLEGYYGQDYNIVDVITCNTELVIFVKQVSTNKVDIFRYLEKTKEQTEQMVLSFGGITSNNRLPYNGGEIKGTFTYNVEGSLVIAFCEHGNSDVKNPMYTINLGNVDDPDVASDRDVSYNALSTSPRVRLPMVDNINYLAGSAYKGWYYLFIRYKINTVDYSQWYSIGVPVYVDTLEHYQILRYCYNRETKFTPSPINTIVSPSLPFDGFGAGFSDHFSNSLDIAKETFSIDLSFDQTAIYDIYQIGIICSSKSYNKAFRTSDINFRDTEGYVKKFVLDNKSLIEYSALSLIEDNFNYFNVENIINYKNKLYISNYEESNANDKDIPQEIIDDIQVTCVVGAAKDYGVSYDIAVINKEFDVPNQYDGSRMTIFPLYEYLGVKPDTIVNVTDGTNTKTDRADVFFITSENITPNFACIEHREWVSVTIARTYFGKGSEKNVTIKIVYTNNTYSPPVIFNTTTNAINGGSRYINTNKSFNTRKKESTLIEGEIYNFFIHFVDEYGHATNGKRISNNIKWTAESNRFREITPIPFTFLDVDGNRQIIYAAIPLNMNVARLDISGEYVIDTQDVEYYRSYSDYGQEPYLYDQIEIDTAEYTRQFTEYFNCYADIKYADYKWFQVSFGPGRNFHLFINNNNDRLFRVPIVENYQVGIDGFPDIDVKDTTIYNIVNLYRASFSNIEVPKKYVGYYISYEKFEATKRVTGILTRSDFRNQDWITVDSINVNRKTANSAKSDRMFFFSGQYDIADSIKLDYNIIRIEGVNIFKPKDIPEWDYFQRNTSFNFVHDQNKPQLYSYAAEDNRCYAIPDYKIVVADSASDNRIGLGTALQLKDSYNLFPNYQPSESNNNKIKIYRVTLLNTGRNIYISNNKTLVRLTDVFYVNPDREEGDKFSTSYIWKGYNGHYTFDGVIVYENGQVTFNTTTNKAKSGMGDSEYYQSSVDSASPHVYQNDIPFAAYIQFPVCDDIFYESKSYKNAPKGIIYLMRTIAEQNTFAKGSFVTPLNSIDLFENKQSSADVFNPKTYTNYRDDLVSIDVFNKTVRRSNVIQDETRINGWRKFSIEAYKNITENKGIITNLIGIGSILLVHTEHSLFMFDTSNVLKTLDKDVQMLQPDVFEVDYREVFTSDKGFGGLQDSKSFAVDQFGYIFYSEDTNRIYNFDNGQLAVLDDDIIEWLNRYKPYKVRMANDKKNTRLLFKFNYMLNDVEKYVVISYNYKTKGYICTHSYHFDYGYNTKTNLYMRCDNEHVGCSLHSFVEYNNQYGRYDNVKGEEGTVVVKPSKISIIVNAMYDEVKFLEYIRYKLTKYKADKDADYTHSPVEDSIEPFSGNLLSIYNNSINTGVLNVSVDTEATKNTFANFNKPFWDKGVWNFSYIRNKISEYGSLSSLDMSRVYGNYFIIEFTFNNEDNKRVEFEEINTNISFDK